MDQNLHKRATDAIETYDKDREDSKSAARVHIYERESGRIAFASDVVLNSSDQTTRNEAFWNVVGHMVKDIEYYKTEADRYRSSGWGLEDRNRALTTENLRLKEQLEVRKHIDHRPFRFGAISTIKAIRQIIPGLGLHEAKKVVDFIRELGNTSVTNWSDYKIEWNSRVPDSSSSPAVLKD